MADKGVDGASLRQAWTSLGQRTAVAGGALVAFLGLFHHVSATTAALRGACTWLALLAAVRLGGWALDQSRRLDEQAGLTGVETADMNDTTEINRLEERPVE